MGLLRASSNAIGQDVTLEGSTEGEAPEEIKHGNLLVTFAESVTRGNDEMDDAREALRAAIDDDGVIEASSIIGIFNGLDRTADLSGIPLDEGTLHVSADFRERLGLNDLVGAAQTRTDTGDAERAPDSFFDFHSTGR